AAAWLERDDKSSGQGVETIAAITRGLRPALEEVGPLEVSLADGVMAWLVRQRESDPVLPAAGFPEPALSGIGELLEVDHAPGRLARMRAVAGYRAEAIWAQVIAASGGEAAGVADYWAPMLAELDAAEDDAAVAHAGDQARRVRALAAADSALERARIHDQILQAQARRAWETGRLLDALWFAFEGLARLLPANESAGEMAADWAGWLAAVAGEHSRSLRLIDFDLPVVLALLGDAADALATPERSLQPAVAALADSYARLTLFAPDLAFYLDQPVREGVRRVISIC